MHTEEGGGVSGELHVSKHDLQGLYVTRHDLPCFSGGSIQHALLLSFVTNYQKTCIWQQVLFKNVVNKTAATQQHNSNNTATKQQQHCNKTATKQQHNSTNTATPQQQHSNTTATTQHYTCVKSLLLDPFPEWYEFTQVH